MLPLVLVVGITSGVATSFFLDKTSNDLEFCKNSQRHKVLKKYNIDMANKKCEVCGKKLTEEDLSMIIPYNEKLYFVCDSQRCLTLKDVAIGLE
jgi:hypothetical protein